MLRRLPWAISLLFLVYVGLLAIHSGVGFPQAMQTQSRWPWLGDKPVGEDGFYMLTVADHMAREHHITYNYGQPATGFQPLTTFMWAGIDEVNLFLGGDRWSLVRAVFCFQAFLFLAFAWLLASFAARLTPYDEISPGKRDLVFALTFVLSLLDFSLFRLFTYGLETGPYLTCLAVCLLVWHRLVSRADHRWRWATLFGVAGGITGLARIDFGIVFAFTLAFLLLKRYLAPAQVLLSGAIALLLVSPWFLYVHGVTGGWLPSSGKAESELITLRTLDRFPAAAVALVTHLVPWSFAGANHSMEVFGLVCLAGLGLWMAMAEKPLLTSLSPEARRTLLPWAVAFGALVVVYPVFFWVEWFYPRYFAPLAVVWIPILAMFLARQPVIQRMFAVFVATLLLVFCAEDAKSLHTGRVATNHIVSAGYIQQFYPTERVGAFQSGAIGYFDPNVMNLDGKMNDGALRADARHRLDDFLDTNHINVLVDWKDLMRGHLPDAYLAAKWQPCPQPMPVPNSVCFVRKAP